MALPERISEIERLLQELGVYHKKLNDLSLWASKTKTKLECSPDAVNTEVNIQHNTEIKHIRLGNNKVMHQTAKMHCFTILTPHYYVFGIVD